MAEIQIARDWLDYAEATGVFISLILAGVALLLARSSAQDAETSADAAALVATLAEEQLAIAKKERETRLEEESRRPDLSLDLRVEKVQRNPEGMTSFRVELSSRNVGNKAADSALVALRVGQNVQIVKCDPTGQPVKMNPPHPQDEYVIRSGTGEVAAQTAGEEADIQIHRARAVNYLLVFPAVAGGVFDCRAMISWGVIQKYKIMRIQIPERADDLKIPYSMSPVHWSSPPEVEA